tara:strand:- start:310 stop:477 length:168 start_codon:yes stop_codon:yes gene_type:complete
MFTVWVGGTEVNNDYVYYDEAKRLYDYYKEKGYIDVIVKQICVVGQHLPHDKIGD